jgi:DNA processing protein
MCEQYNYVTPGSAEYPNVLVQRYGNDAPKLWYRGDISLLKTLDEAVGVFGARASTGYGEHVAMDFAAGLVSRGRTVITRGNYGIDGMATRATLSCGGNPIVVNPAGMDTFYPTGHDELFRRVADKGLVVSMFEPGTIPDEETIKSSNKLLINLSSIVVCVEAGAKGKSYSMGKYALENGVYLCAVPGPITSGGSAGSHRLIAEGATLVTSVADVLEMKKEFANVG